ncbi:MAG: LLM class flavin-dependent oxidoreductase [Cytophagales bacterium]|nr:MAG: LLM class flavin-dependent oxidoreductase [Cytophagales bacterium]
MQVGIDSFVAVSDQTGANLSDTNAMTQVLDRIELADRVGLDVFGIGEHHRRDFQDSATAVILAAAAARTSRIRLSSAVTVLSAADPVRVFQQFATLDLISKGRAELVVGRGSFTEAFPLFGLNIHDYDELFTEKLGLLLAIRDNEHVHWSGRFRPALTGQGIYPRPVQNPLPIWIGVGGTPQSFVRAGTLGLPLMVAVIGGETHRFRPLIDLYRRAGAQAGHAPEKLKVGLHSLGFVGETTKEAVDAFYPGYAETFTKIGRERGWPPVSRPHFDAQNGQTGALLVGDPDEIAAKIKRHSDALGGINLISFQMDSAKLTNEQLLRSIELLGTEVAPLVRG